VRVPDRSLTLCYCSSREGADGRPLALCSDCVGWLRENSPRIAQHWAWWLQFGHLNAYTVGLTGKADGAELNALGVYMARRFYGG
jgi:hypothetical protein